MCGEESLKPTDLCIVDTDADKSSKINACSEVIVSTGICYCGIKGKADDGDHCDIKTGLVTSKCIDDTMTEIRCQCGTASFFAEPGSHCKDNTITPKC